MEGLDYKLKSGNSITVAQVVSKLFNRIQSAETDNIEELQEYKFLKEKCLDVDPLVSQTASSALIILVEENPSRFQSVVADFIARISSLKYFPNLVYLLNNLLLIDLRAQVKKSGCYKNPYNSRLPQHPFITILNENSNAWIYVFEEIKNTLKFPSNEPRLIQDILSLYKPVCLYVICNPDESNFPVFKYKLWSLLLNRCDIVDEILCWLQLDAEKNILVNNELINSLIQDTLDVSPTELNSLIAWEASILNRIVQYKLNPLDTIGCISDLVHSTGHELTSLNAVVLLLSKSILICPVTYLLDLLNLCKLVISKNVQQLAIEVLKSILLQWVANDTTLSARATKVAQEILFLSEVTTIKQKPLVDKPTIEKVHKMTKMNGDVYLAVKTWAAMTSWSDSDSVLQFLEKLERVPEFFLTEFIHILFMTFINDFGDNQITIKSQNLLLICCRLNRALSAYFLTLVLFKLSNTVDPELHYELLKVLPEMGSQRENVKKVSNTIFALSKGSNYLKTCSLKLMFELWKNSDKCYPYLENLLVTNMGICSEIMVTKAFILKEICLLKPELYGRDMVAHLSKILNECNTEHGAVPSSLAIEGISYLCKEGIIDIITTWATLAPKFQNETRTPVIKSLCVLLSVIPTLSYVEAYPQLLKDVVSKLWNYVIPNPQSESTISDTEVMGAALDALSHFSIEEISVTFPSCFLETNLENSLDPDVSVVAPGWLNLLKDSKPVPMNLIADFLIKIISQEISGYLKFVYQTKKGNTEPTSYSYLPANSCVRCMGKFLKNEVLGWKGTVNENAYLECLRIFSQHYSKPLPPLDWCFLQELIHDPKTKKYSITIASKQVILSGTARRLIENYLIALAENHADTTSVINVYEILENIGNSIQPMVLKPFIHETFNYALILHKDDTDKGFFRSVLDNIVNFMKNHDIQDTNKMVIADVVKNVVDQLTVEDEIFNLLLDILAVFPTKVLDSISVPKYSSNLSTGWLQKAIKIRCEVSKITKTSALNVLNEIINHEDLSMLEEEYIFQNFASVFQHHISSTDPALWLVDLIDQIQFQVADKSALSNILFKCRVLMLAVIVFSGHSIFMDEGKYSLETLLDLFPRAVATLFDFSHWNICVIQAMDWFYYMNTDAFIQTEYRICFGQALQALRHEEEFKKNMRWMKYLNAETKIL